MTHRSSSLPTRSVVGLAICRAHGSAATCKPDIPSDHKPIRALPFYAF